MFQVTLAHQSALLQSLEDTQLSNVLMRLAGEHTISEQPAVHSSQRCCFTFQLKILNVILDATILEGEQCFPNSPQRMA